MKSSDIFFYGAFLILFGVIFVALWYFAIWPLIVGMVSYDPLARYLLGLLILVFCVIGFIVAYYLMRRVV